MLGEFSGKNEPRSRLDVAGGEGRPLVDAGQLGGLHGQPLEDVVGETGTEIKRH